MDLIGSTTGLGDTIWAADDQLLCPNGLKSGGAHRPISSTAVAVATFAAAGLPDGRRRPGEASMTGAPGELNDGYSSVFMPKVVTDPPAYSGSEIRDHRAGRLRWHLDLGADHHDRCELQRLAGSGSLSNHLVNVYFAHGQGACTSCGRSSIWSATWETSGARTACRRSASATRTGFRSTSDRLRTDF